MPRQNAPRRVNAERHLAARVAREREAAGWTPAQLAERLTAAGCPINLRAIYRIEAGERSISFDEAVAFAKVFGTTLDDLTTSPEALDERLAELMIDEIDEALQGIVGQGVRLVTAFGRLARLEASVHGRRAFQDAMDVLGAPWCPDEMPVEELIATKELLPAAARIVALASEREGMARYSDEGDVVDATIVCEACEAPLPSWVLDQCPKCGVRFVPIAAGSELLAAPAKRGGTRPRPPACPVGTGPCSCGFPVDWSHVTEDTEPHDR